MGNIFYMGLIFLGTSYDRSQEWGRMEREGTDESIMNESALIMIVTFNKAVAELCETMLEERKGVVGWEGREKVGIYIMTIGESKLEGRSLM